MISIIDFDDSFVYNIACELNQQKQPCQVVPFDHSLIEDFVREGHAIIWGPGPGHPREYQDKIFPLIDMAFAMKKPQLGICLGHQLLLSYLGMKVQRSARPLHGQAITLPLTFAWQTFFSDSKESVQVQRYNSLVVSEREFLINCSKLSYQLEALCLGAEVMAFRGPFFYGLQFHPESVGTNGPGKFFTPLVNSMYTRKDHGHRV